VDLGDVLAEESRRADPLHVAARVACPKGVVAIPHVPPPHRS
jgi:hypothetical protein